MLDHKIKLGLEVYETAYPAHLWRYGKAVIECDGMVYRAEPKGKKER